MLSVVAQKPRSTKDSRPISPLQTTQGFEPLQTQWIAPPKDRARSVSFIARMEGARKHVMFGKLNPRAAYSLCN